MEQFRTYSPEDIILTNLNETAERHASLFEQELAHISELVREWTQSIPKNEDLIPSLPDVGLEEVSTDRENHLAQSFDILQKLESIHTVEKNILLSREITQQISCESVDLIQMLLSESDAKEPVQSPYIHYQKNSFTDTAYLRFAKLFQAPRARYTHSYQSSCEDVFNGLCEYCILPLENTAEGRMVGFLKLIDSYSLKLIATCDIFGSDMTKSTTFALLGKQIEPMNGKNQSDPLYFELVCQIEENSIPTEWLTAATLSDLHITRLHTIPDGKNDGKNVCHAVFSVPSVTALATFLIYLSIKAPQFLPIGLYPHLSFQK